MRTFPAIPLASCLFVTVFALALAPAWARQPASAQQHKGSATSAEVEATTPPSPASLDHETQTPHQAADDQLPAYLQENAGIEANSETFDPWERYNRRVYRFNKRVDKWLIEPIALAYLRRVPRRLRNRVSDFHQNLLQPATAANLLLQGRPGRAVESLGRFAINSTLGVVGLFDLAKRMHIPSYNEDFGQTLGHWGWRRSRYFLLPFLGPGTVRDRIGALGDAELGVYSYFHPLALRVGVIGTVLVDTRVRAMPLEELTTGVDDDYLLVREAWSQRRMHQIDDQRRIDRDGSQPN